MHLLRCTLTLHDTLFFASREMGVLYETERYQHNYALSYALFSNNLTSRSFFCDTYQPDYAGDLGKLTEAGIYVTPARPMIWDYLLITWKIGQVTYYRRPERFGESGRNYPANYGRAKERAPESVFEGYILATHPLTLPRWIRLGKWMSKVLVEVESLDIKEREGPFTAACPLNPLDVPEGMLRAFDIISMPPSSLVANARLEGRYYEIGGSGRGIPIGMRYNIPVVEQSARRSTRRQE